MARIYANACERQGKNFNTVPASKSKEVKALILADGYIINEDGTVVKRPINE